MKTLIALIILTTPVFAGWTYPSFSTLMAMQEGPDPCFVPPGGTPPDTFYECPAGECPTNPGLASANETYSLQCYANGAARDACIAACDEDPVCEQDCESGYYAAQLAAKAQWQRAVEDSCAECP